jgi:alpha-ribazole phosphatase
MPTSRTIYLVRHTKPDIPKGICYGQSDIGVFASFQEEAAITKAKICSFENVAHLNTIPIVSSPLQRCFLLAKELHNQETMFEQNMRTDDRFKEMNFGDWEMQEWSAIDEFVMSAWMRDYVNIRATNGESFREVVQRSNEAFRELAEADSKHKSIILVAHSGVIRAILAHHLEMPLHKAFSLEIDYGSISAIKYRPHYSSVLFVNR